MKLNKISGSKIAYFFRCSFENVEREKLGIIRPKIFGILMEKVYQLKKKGLKAQEILSFIAHYISHLEISKKQDLKKFARRAINMLYNLDSHNNANIVETNLLCEDENFKVEIDLFLRKNKIFFPREVKSYKSPVVYAWNSDIMQLVVQSIVLENYYGINVRYGEILYLANNKLIPIDTYLLREHIYLVQMCIFKGIVKINCEICKKINMNKCVM